MATALSQFAAFDCCRSAMGKIADEIRTTARYQQNYGINGQKSFVTSLRGERVSDIFALYQKILQMMTMQQLSENVFSISNPKSTLSMKC